MRRIGWPMLGAGFTCFALWIGACSTPASGPPAEEEDAGESSSGETSKPSSSTSSSSGSSSGSTLPPVIDAAVNPLPTGPATNKPTPLQVGCGAGLATLCAKESRCCWPDFSVANSKCVALTAPEGCGEGEAFDVKCDEKADCPGADERCCLGYGETVCTNDCFDDSIAQGVQVCKTDAECDQGVTCAERTCTLGEPGAERVLKLRICGTTAECK